MELFLKVLTLLSAEPQHWIHMYQSFFSFLKSLQSSFIPSLHLRCTRDWTCKGKQHAMKGLFTIYLIVVQDHTKEFSPIRFWTVLSMKETRVLGGNQSYGRKDLCNTLIHNNKFWNICIPNRKKKTSNSLILIWCNAQGSSYNMSDILSMPQTIWWKKKYNKNLHEFRYFVRNLQ